MTHHPKPTRRNGRIKWKGIAEQRKIHIAVLEAEREILEGRFERLQAQHQRERSAYYRLRDCLFHFGKPGIAWRSSKHEPQA